MYAQQQRQQAQQQQQLPPQMNVHFLFELPTDLNESKSL